MKNGRTTTKLRFGIYTAQSQYEGKMLSYEIEVESQDDIKNSKEWKQACSIYNFVQARKIKSDFINQ